MRFLLKLWAVAILLCGLPAGIPVMAADITMTSVTLYCTAPGDDGNAGRASQYDVRYHTQPITEQNWSAAIQVEDEPVPSASGTTESLTIDDLSPGTTYYFAIKAADEVPNWSVLSNVFSATTLPFSLDIDEEEDIVPAGFELSQNFPNPFNPSTKIVYSVPIHSRIQINIYSLQGRLVKMLVDGSRSPGRYTVSWNGTDNEGKRVASGVYFCRLAAGEFTESRKMMLIQ